MSNGGLSSFSVAAGKVPPSLSPEERYSSYNGVPMVAVIGVFTTIALCFYLVRMYTKIWILQRVRWDDLFCTIGMIGALIDVVCFAIASIKGPLGKHIWNITLAQFLARNFVIPAYIMQVTATLTLGVIKLTIFLFYFDAFGSLTWCRWAIYIGASLNSAFYLAMTIVQFYFMTPRPGETMAKHFGGKLAAKVTKLSIPTSSVGLAIDIMLFIIPLRAVIQLHITRKKKIRLICTFLVGAMAIIGSILSLSFKVKTYGNPDLTYHLILVNFFICVEMVFGIIIASAPLVSKAASCHRAQLISFVSTISTPLRYIMKTRATPRTTMNNEAADVEQGFDAKGFEVKNYVGELARLETLR